MTITLEIRPEIQDELARQAAAKGLGVRDYAAGLLEGATHAASLRPAPLATPKDMVELFAPLRGFNLEFERDRDTGKEIHF